MKSAFLHFLMSSCASLIFATAYADPIGPPSQQSPPESAVNSVSSHPYGAGFAAPAKSGKNQKDVIPSGERHGHRQVFEKNHPRSQVPVASNHPKQPPNNREHSPSGNAMLGHQPGSDKRRTVARTGSIQGNTVNSVLPVRSVNSFRPNVPMRSTVRHRSANPAVIGGSASSVLRNTGAINGTSVHRRP